MRRAAFAVAGVALVGIVAVAGLTVSGSDDEVGGRGSAGRATETDQVDPSQVATDAARSFLDTYVDDDGRVVRRDQGGDTVSEGQAYGLLLAVAVGDRERFDAVWSWTEANLLRDDGLLAWHWADGAITDANPATDADLDAARALVLAGDRFDSTTYRGAGLALADAVLTHETVEVGDRLVLLAGPWATGPPIVANPSYVSPETYALLGRASGDPRWERLRLDGYELLDEVTDQGSRLPADWATVDADGRAEAGEAPGGAPARYGYDGFRTLLRLAEACDGTGPDTAAALRPMTERTVDDPAEFHELDGGVETSGTNPTLLLAAAAARSADGSSDAAQDLIDRAAAAEADDPSYYLSAWVALGRLLLDSDELGGCPPGAATDDAPTPSSTTTPPEEGAAPIGDTPACDGPVVAPTAADLGGIDPAGSLGGRDLAGLDLSCVDLAGIDLRGSDLGGTDLSGADLRGADLRGADLRGAVLDGARLGSSDLRGARLAGARTAGTDLRGSRLAGVVLDDLDLGGVRLDGADLAGARFQGTDLTGAALTDAQLPGADLGGAVLDGVTWTGARCPDGRPAAPACSA